MNQAERTAMLAKIRACIGSTNDTCLALKEYLYPGVGLSEPQLQLLRDARLDAIDALERLEALEESMA